MNPSEDSPGHLKGGVSRNVAIIPNAAFAWHVGTLKPRTFPSEGSNKRPKRELLILKNRLRLSCICDISDCWRAKRQSREAQRGRETLVRHLDRVQLRARILGFVRSRFLLMGLSCFDLGINELSACWSIQDFCAGRLL